MVIILLSVCFASFQPERVESLIVVDTAPKESPGADTLRTYAEKMKNVPMPPASKSMPEGRRLVDNELKTFIQVSM